MNMIKKGLGLYMENFDTNEGNAANKRMMKGTQNNQELSCCCHTSGHVGNNLVFMSLDLWEVRYK